MCLPIARLALLFISFILLRMLNSPVISLALFQQDKDGVNFHPRQYGALTKMPPPTTARALMELVHGANWMRTAILEIFKLVNPLLELLEKNYTLQKSRKKSRLTIKEQATIATPDPNERICLFTDASSTHWSGVLTQVSLADV